MEQVLGNVHLLCCIGLLQWEEARLCGEHLHNAS